MDSQPKTSKSLYDAPLGEVAVKNFFAGFMHGLGGFFVTLLSWTVLYFLITRVVVPQFSGMLSQAEGLLKSAEKMQGAFNGATNLMAPQSTGTGKTNGGSGIVIPPELIQQMQSFQQSQQK